MASFARTLYVAFLSLLMVGSLMAAPLPTGPGKQVAVFVALCDNEYQGIEPVPAKIGNGQDASANLYWGCSDALPKVMRASARWGRPVYYKEYDGRPEAVLEAVVCTNSDKTATVYAFAYRGDCIRECMLDFEAAIAASQYDFVAYIGHNGLMDEELAEPEPAVSHSDVAVLCCMSDEWFTERVHRLGARPVLMTRQFMYPAGKVLTEALDAWLKSPSSCRAIRDAAARAYANNQGISVKAATGVFTSPAVK